MKLQDQINNVVTNTESTGSFGVNIDSFMYDILSSGIYKDKPLAVVRELVANALDSHKSAKQKEPVVIYAPTEVDPTLIIEDKGTGLSVEDTYKYFFTYGGSDKRNSDNDIGGFGLGCKSPLAYSDAFTLEVTFGGVKTVYSVYKDVDGIPVPAVMAEIQTDDCNGITVKIPVKTKDISSFITAIDKVYAYIPKDKKPLVHGIDTPRDLSFDTKVEYKNNNGYVSNVVYVISGGIMYKFDYMPDFFKSLTKVVGTPYINAEISDVAPAVDRESLQIIQKNKDFVDKVLKEEAATLDTRAQAFLDKFKDTNFYTLLSGLDHTYSNFYCNNTEEVKSVGFDLHKYIVARYNELTFCGKSLSDIDVSTSNIHFDKTKVFPLGGRKRDSWSWASRNPVASLILSKGCIKILVKDVSKHWTKVGAFMKDDFHLAVMPEDLDDVIKEIQKYQFLTYTTTTLSSLKDHPKLVTPKTKKDPKDRAAFSLNEYKVKVFDVDGSIEGSYLNVHGIKGLLKNLGDCIVACSKSEDVLRFSAKVYGKKLVLLPEKAYNTKTVKSSVPQVFDYNWVKDHPVTNKELMKYKLVKKCEAVLQEYESTLPILELTGCVPTTVKRLRSIVKKTKVLNEGTLKCFYGSEIHYYRRKTNNVVIDKAKRDVYNKFPMLRGYDVDKRGIKPEHVKEYIDMVKSFKKEK